MGTRIAPSYANLFMGKLEKEALKNAPFKPYVWWRFIDDIFMVWTEGEDNLKTFIHYLNSIHPTIKFTHEYSNSLHQTLLFLDVQVHFNNKQIQTDLHTKPTDKHQYLLKTSCHPAHTKRTIPFSLALRLRRICSTDIFFSKRCQELINFLQSRGYSRRFLKKEINRVRNIPRQETLKPRPQNNDSVQTPFVITYTPALPNVSTVIRKNVNILQSSTRCKQTFPSPPIVAYSPNLRDLLVKSTVRGRITPPKPPSGISKCRHPRCLTCPFLQQGQLKYTFSTTREERRITDSLSCKSKNLIYLIECKKCGKQYIGETKRQLNERFGEHRRSILNHNQIINPTPISEHFNQPGHSINGVLLIYRLNLSTTTVTLLEKHARPTLLIKP